MYKGLHVHLPVNTEHALYLAYL